MQEWTAILVPSILSIGTLAFTYYKFRSEAVERHATIRRTDAETAHDEVQNIESWREAYQELAVRQLQTDRTMRVLRAQNQAMLSALRRIGIDPAQLEDWVEFDSPEF